MYKKIVLFILIGIFFIVCVSCITPVATVGTQETPLLPSEGSLSLEETQPVSLVQITAKVEVNAVGTIMLTENWNSKSRKSYEVIGEMSNILRNSIGETIVADVIFLEKKMWNGSLVLVEFKPVNSDNPPGK